MGVILLLIMELMLQVTSISKIFKLRLINLLLLNIMCIILIRVMLLVIFLI